MEATLSSILNNEKKNKYQQLNKIEKHVNSTFYTNNTGKNTNSTMKTEKNIPAKTIPQNLKSSNLFPSENFTTAKKTNHPLKEIKENNELINLSIISKIDFNDDFFSKIPNEISLNNSIFEEGISSEKKLQNLIRRQPIENLTEIPEETLTIVEKPKKFDVRNYVESEVELYSNIYPLKITKNYTINNYFVDFQGDSEHLNTYLKRKIISKSYQELIPIYGVYFYSGENLYSTNRLTDVINIVTIYNKVKYSFIIRPLGEILEIKDYNSNQKNKSLFKNILELMYKDVLRANPDIKITKNMCGKKLTEKIVLSNKNKVLVIPAFSTKILMLEAGIFLNVDNKNKILNGDDCYKLILADIKSHGKPTKADLGKINDSFRGKIIETKHTNQRFKIESINFERNPKNTSVNYDTYNIDLFQYYKKLYGIILNETQPLLQLKSTSNKKSNVGRFYPAELCYLSGLTDEMINDGKLMMNISKNTKLTPNEKVQEIDLIMDLFYQDRYKLKDGISLPSSSQKMKDYGFKIQKTEENLFKGYSMKPPKMIIKNNQTVTNLMKPFKIYDAREINFLCLYHKLYESDKKNLEKTINTAGTAYGISIGKSDYVRMETENIEDWINVIQKKYNPREYNQVIVLLDDYLEYEGFYPLLKEHSLEVVGYPMQVILTNSLHKNAMSVVSNVLLQINSKIGGSLFKIEIPEEIKKNNLMIVGIDISSIKGQNLLNVAMCATINQNFTEYTHKKDSITIQENGSTNHLLSLNVSSFIHEAVQEFFKKNKILPGGIIIYRQGVSKEQRVYLTQEVIAIENLLSGKGDPNTQLIYSKNPIPYYYILVNKKTSLKFFEREQNYGTSNYSNPDCGLLILKDLVESDVFEFYIQPQKVNQGTATPTNFQVIYGNLNIPNYIPKITYDLCYMYSNWRGPVRVPAPLKNAEKLAKTLPKLHENSKNKLYHL